MNTPTATIFEINNNIEGYQLWKKTHPSLSKARTVFKSRGKKRCGRTGQLQERVFVIKGRLLAYKVTEKSERFRACLDLSWAKAVFVELQEQEQGCGHKVIISKNGKYSEIFLSADQIAPWRQALSKVAIFADFHSRYRGISVLGEGSFGQVFEVECSRTSSTFAAKAINKKWILEDKDKNLLMLQNEIEVMRKLSHCDFVPQILEVHETENTIYIVSEVINGPDLGSFNGEEDLKKNSLFKTMASELLRALLELKKNDIIHRDINPNNIMLKRGKTNQVKIIDFGLAFDLSRINSKEYRTSVRCGTPGFIAPEVFQTSEKDTPKRITTKLDVFSLGVVFHQIVYGILPYGCDDQNTVLERNAHDVRHEVDSIADQELENIDALVGDLISGMLQGNPQRRFTIEECLCHPYFQCSE